MFERLKGLLKSEAPSSADLRAESEKLEAEKPRAQTRLAELRDKRQELLLQGSEKDRAAIRLEIMKAEDELEALDVALASLAKRLAEAEAREAAASHRAKIAHAQAASDRAVEKLLPRFHELMTEAAQILGEIEATELIVRESWESSHALGLTKIQGPNHRTRLGRNHELVHVEALAVLPGPTSDATIWPPLREEDRRKVVRDARANLRNADEAA